MQNNTKTSASSTHQVTLDELIASADLWPEMLRVVRECSPTWVVGENVRGLVNWSKGLVFEEVCTDLEAEGYEVQPIILPACGVGAPHRRDRVWFVAYSESLGNGRRPRDVQEQNGQVSQRHDNTKPGDASRQPFANADDRQRLPSHEQVQAGRHAFDGRSSGVAANPQRIRLEHEPQDGNVQRVQSQESKRGRQCAVPAEANGHRRGAANTRSPRHERNEQQGPPRPIAQPRQVPDWVNFPSVAPVCGANDGLSTQLDGLTFSKWRLETIKAYGNAIVPQVALQIFQSINEYEEQRRSARI